MHDTVPVNIYEPEAAAEAGLVTSGFLTEYLGLKRTQWSTWVQRRHANGLPDPAGFVWRGDGLSPLYDFAQVVSWYGSYEPSRVRVDRRPERT